VLPSIQEGETGTVLKTDVKESKTQPPKRFTEGQLITLMKTAGKHIEDKDLEKVLMKTEGLGTEATRAGIITMLKDRAYINISKNLVYATAKAKILVQSVGGQILAAPEMTAKWEQRLKEIGEGTASPKQFMDQTSKMVAHLVASTTESAASWSFNTQIKEEFIPGKQKGRKKRSSNLGACRLCGGAVVDKGSFYGCANYQKTKCGFTVSKQILGKAITQKQVKLLLKEGVTDVIEGFTSKDQSFNAKLIWDENEHSIRFASRVQS
jgi:DNA topoisomerase-3